MLVTDSFDASARREAVRQLSDITDKSYNDDKLDAKITIGDAEARVWLQTTETSDTLIVLSNFLTARNIRQGIGDNDNQNAARDLMTNAKALVEAYNEKSPEQNQLTVTKTAGPDSDLRGTFG